MIGYRLVEYAQMATKIGKAMGGLYPFECGYR